MEIKDASGQLVRKISSEKDKSFQSYPGGPSPAPTITKSKGFNRFVWDRTYPSLLGAPKAYIEGSYRAHKAMPGEYNISLKIEGKEQTTAFNILKNPLVDATEEDFKKQNELMLSTAKTVNDIHGKANELNSQWTSLKAEASTIEREIRSFNQSLKEAGFGAIFIKLGAQP